GVSGGVAPGVGGGGGGGLWGRCSPSADAPPPGTTANERPHPASPRPPLLTPRHPAAGCWGLAESLLKGNNTHTHTHTNTHTHTHTHTHTPTHTPCPTPTPHL